MQKKKPKKSKKSRKGLSTRDTIDMYRYVHQQKELERRRSEVWLYGC